MDAAVPAIEMSDHCDRPGIRSPDPKQGTADFMVQTQLSAEQVVGGIIGAGIEEVAVGFVKQDRKTIRIVYQMNITGPVFDFILVIVWFKIWKIEFFTYQLTLIDSFRVDTDHLPLF